MQLFPTILATLLAQVAAVQTQQIECVEDQTGALPPDCSGQLFEVRSAAFILHLHLAVENGIARDAASTDAYFDDQSCPLRVKARAWPPARWICVR